MEGPGPPTPTVTPTANLAVVDDTFEDIFDIYNTNYGFWCQMCSNSKFTKINESRNGVVDILLGAQWGYVDATHNEYIQRYAFSGGSGCTASTYLPLTITGTTSGFAATGYAYSNASGVITGVYGITSGSGYAGTITASVSGCTSPPSITPVVVSDASLGLWPGVSPTRRGMLTFDNVHSEDSIGTAITSPLSTFSNVYDLSSGFAAGINGGTIGNNAFRDYEFDREQGTNISEYAQLVYNTGGANILQNPGSADSTWDQIVNPVPYGGNTANAVCMTADSVGGGLELITGPSPMTGSSPYNPTSYMCDSAGQTILPGNAAQLDSTLSTGNKAFNGITLYDPYEAITDPSLNNLLSWDGTNTYIVAETNSGHVVAYPHSGGSYAPFDGSSYYCSGNLCIPSTINGYQGAGTKIQIGQNCTTGSIGGSALSAGGSASGTCTLGTSATGHEGVTAASDGSVQGNYIPQVSVSGTAATVTVTAITAGTPTTKTYNVTVF